MPTPQSGSGSITPLQTQQTLVSLLQMVQSLSPDSIKASSEALQQQLTITEQMQSDLDAAKQTIAEAAGLKDALAAREAAVKQSEDELDDKWSIYRQQDKDLSARITSFNQNEDAQKKRAADLDARAASLDAREVAVTNRENAVTDRETAATKREDNLAVKEQQAAEFLKKLQGGA